jgi:hypothetical protein
MLLMCGYCGMQLMHAYGIDHCKCIWCNGPARLPAAPAGRNAWAAAAHRWCRGTALIQKPFCKREGGNQTGRWSPITLTPRLLASQTPPFLASTPTPPRKDMSRTARNILHLRSPVWLVGGRCSGDRSSESRW